MNRDLPPGVGSRTAIQICHDAGIDPDGLDMRTARAIEVVNASRG